MRLQWKLTVASLKMFTRQKEAIIWTMLLPLFMVFLFGFVSFEGLGKIRIGVAGGEDEPAGRLVGKLGEVRTVQVTRGAESSEQEQLMAGKRHLVLVLPEEFDAVEGKALRVLVNDGTPEETQLGLLVLRKLLDDETFGMHSAPDRVPMTLQSVTSRRSSYIDFLLPGVLSLAIMQSGIFGVAFGFVALRKRGVLRRLSVTPMRPQDFIAAQVAMRLMVLLAQIVVLVGVGIAFFDLQFMGSLLDLFAMGLLGGAVFLAIGFFLAGIARTEDQVVPLANVVSLPMMLLSGVFFSRSNLPEPVRVVTEFFPLTYLADGMRSIVLDGSTLPTLWLQLAGLGLWSVVSVWVAVKVFRWE
ncbi:MAG: ABC transporter permease [Acidobacteria bacterium]|nr:ABC transporter permease [Acidobacteriota bacterium]